MIVLVHGAWHGAWCWDAVTRELSARGTRSTAVELPLTGLRDDVAAVRRAIEQAGDDVVVCSHSYGGMVVSAAASGLPGIRHLVYLAAFQADEGENTATLFGRELSALAGALEVTPDGLTVAPSRVHEVFYADSDPLDIEGIAARLRPMPLDDPDLLSVEPAWKTIPSTYVVCARDNAIAPATQRFLAARASRVVEWDTDHSPFLTRPAEVAELLITC